MVVYAFINVRKQDDEPGKLCLFIYSLQGWLVYCLLLSLFKFPAHVGMESGRSSLILFAKTPSNTMSNFLIQFCTPLH
jgi:hypothetical protein